jgi:hypothetical protein
MKAPPENSNVLSEIEARICFPPKDYFYGSYGTPPAQAGIK